MVEKKHLRELLREIQEPFMLNDYIAERRHHLRREAPSKTQIQLKKRRPVSEPSSSTFSFPHNLCSGACFVSSSEVSKSSPFFPKSPCKSPNLIFPHTPSRTAAVLLQAAARVQQSPKTRIRKPGFGMFGSVLTKLSHHRNRNKRREIGEARVSVKDVISKENAEISLDFETFPSCCDDSIGFGLSLNFNSLFTSTEADLCESPIRFSLNEAPTSGQRTPEFSSPMAHRKEEMKNHREEKCLDGERDGKEVEDDKEQCSPVSVLDPPFNDDDDDVNGDNYDNECSYALVEKAKQKLLQKLCRFEKLAELDTFELEKITLEEDDEDVEEERDLNEDRRCDIYDALLVESRSEHVRRMAVEMKRLAVDMIEEERECDENGEAVAKRVCQRLQYWEEVEYETTIDMMVEMDFRRHGEEWKGNQEQLEDLAMEIEGGVFGVLVEELCDEIGFA